MSTRTVHRVCTLCEATCGISVEVEGRKVLRIRGDEEDPFSQGHICPKAHGLLELQDDPDRLRRPLRRTDDGFVEIGWEEAVALAGDGLARARDDHGVDAVALYRGNPTTHDFESLLYWTVLQRAMPTKNKYSAGSLDTWPRWVQAGLMYGGFLNTPVADVDRCDYLLMLGANPLASNGSLLTAPGIRKRLDLLRARGGKLVVVDPRRSETAERADEHHFIRPGGDAALLLAMVQVLFDEGLVDLGAAAPHAVDLERVEEQVRAYAPERVERACGVPAQTIRRLAREFAAAPAAACYGRMGTCVQRFGTLANWGIDLLNILTGNLDRPGGVLFPNPAVKLSFAGPNTREGAPFGRYRSRGGHDEIIGEYPMAAFADEIERPGEGQIRALAIIAGNPVASAPNSARIARALEGLDFTVAFDFYVNETTRHADLIIPPTSPLEHEAYDAALMHFAVRNVAKWSPPALEEEADTQPMWRTLLQVSKRLMGLDSLSDEQLDDLVVKQLGAAVIEHSRFAGEIDADDALAALGGEPGPARLLDLMLRAGPHGDGFGREPGGLTLEKLAAHEHGLDLGALEPSLPAPLATPSGRIELAPQRIVDDLPRLDAWLEGAATDERLQLIGRRDIRSMNSWLHNLPSLMKGRERCTLQMNRADAERLGVSDSGKVELEARVGKVVVPVEITDRMAPGVVSLPHGWGHDLPGIRLSVASQRPGVNKNLVVDDEDLDVPSGTSVLNGIPVRVSAVD